jgi:hypothetical protein
MDLSKIEPHSFGVPCQLGIAKAVVALLVWPSVVAWAPVGESEGVSDVPPRGEEEGGEGVQG